MRRWFLRFRPGTLQFQAVLELSTQTPQQLSQVQHQINLSAQIHVTEHLGRGMVDPRPDAEGLRAGL